MTAKTFSVAIVGAGIAGISAAIWCDDLGIDCCLIEKADRSGGQLNSIHNPIRNYPGIAEISSERLLAQLENQLERAAKVTRSLSNVTAIENRDLITVTTSDGTVIEAKAMIFAAGIRRRELGVEGEREFKGRGIISSGSKEKESLSGCDVVIVGGGDAAVENASIIAEFARAVTVVFRGNGLRARPELIAQAESYANVSFISRSRVVRFSGDGELSSVSVSSSEGEAAEITATKALIRIGVEPNSELVSSLVDLDEDGYILADIAGRTSDEKIFAVGDVASPIGKTLAAAAGQGSAAAKAVYRLFTKDR